MRVAVPRHTTGLHFVAAAAMLVACAGLVMAGCRTSGGPKQRATYGSETKALAQYELDRWHDLKQQMTANGTRRSNVPNGSTAAAASLAVRAADPQVANRNEKTDPPQTASRENVVLRPGDVIEAKFYFTPELDVTQMVRPDGKIALLLVGEVTVEGYTPSQVTRTLLNLYQPHLKDPQITVLVKSLYERRVYVGGQVIRPGVIDMPGEMTIMEAIMGAGGFDLREAEVESVLVVRQEGNRWQGYQIDMKPALKGDVTDQFFLRPKDIVYVPRTRIAEVGQWVDDHINKLIPRLPFYFSMPLGQ